MAPRRTFALVAFALSIPVVGGCQATVAPTQPAEARRLAEFDIDQLDAALLALGGSFSDPDDIVPEFLDVPDAESSVDGGIDRAAFRDPGIGIGHAELAEMFSHRHLLVERWIEYFTGRGRSQFERFLERKAMYGEAIRGWLRDEGVPDDLIWLAFIESGINPLAYSRAHAAGIWQFIPGTGRVYGLKYDFWTDERRDPERATRAAARHLKDLFEAYGSWELAFSAYNAGPRRVERAVRVAGHRDYWRMVHQSHVLPRETRHYVPKMVAVYRIGQRPEAYGFTLTAPPASMAWRTIELPSRVALADVARQAGLEERDLKPLNLHLRRGLTPPSGRSFVNVPLAQADQIEAWVAAGNLPRAEFGGIHVVRRGDTLSDLARAYGTTVSDLRALNGLGTRSLLRIGQQLAVPTPGRQSRATTVAAVASEPIRTSSVVVRRGDTLGRIAARSGTTVAALRQLNGLEGDHIVVGQRLRVRDSAEASTEAQTTYRVRSGDTLWSIAQRFNVSIEAIRSLNGLRGSAIRAGDVLRIPGARTS